MLRITKDHFPWSCSGSFLWVCPVCGSVNAWCEGDAGRASQRLGISVEVSHGSCFDNVCGGCGRDIIEPGSPILAEVYTH